MQIVCPLLQESQLARLHERSRLYPVEVDTAGEICGLELNLMIPCFLFAILQKCDLLPEGVEDRQHHVRTIGKSIADRGRRIKRVRKILR
jgi:hypothetical protein